MGAPPTRDRLGTAIPHTGDAGASLEQMSLDIGVTGLPGLQIEVDLEPRLRVSGVRDLDNDGSVAVGAGLTISTPEELEQLLAGIRVNLNPHVSPRSHSGSFGTVCRVP